MSNPMPPPPPPPAAYPPPRPAKPGSPWKWVFIGCLGALVLGAIGIGLTIWFVSKSFTTEPGKVEALAQEVLDFDIPPGVHGAFAMDILGMQMVALEPEDTRNGEEIAPNRFGLVLMTMPSYAYGGNRKEFEKNFKDGMSRGGQDFEVQTRLESENFTVRGKEVEARVEIATTKSGSRRRQYRMVIEGTEKPVLLFIFGQGVGLDHEAIQAFLDTIR